MFVYSDLTEFVKFIFWFWQTAGGAESLCWNKISCLEKFIFVELSTKQIMLNVKAVLSICWSYFAKYHDPLRWYLIFINCNGWLGVKQQVTYLDHINKTLWRFFFFEVLSKSFRAKSLATLAMKRKTRKKSILLSINPLDIYWQIMHVKDIIHAK